MKKIVYILVLLLLTSAAPCMAEDSDAFGIKDTFRTYITSPIRI